MRVLLVDYSTGFGGATKSIGLVRQQLDGVELRVLTSQDDQQCALWYAGLPIHRFRRVLNYVTLASTKKRSRRWFGPLGPKLVSAADRIVAWIGLVKVIWIIKRHRIELVHFNTGPKPEEVVWAIRLLKLRSVTHLRGFPTAVSPRIARQCDMLVIGVSHAVRNRFIENGGDPARIFMVWDPVDFTVFDATASERDRVRQSLGVQSDAIAVGIFGRVTGWKGQLEFVQACIAAMDRGARIRPVIVGSISDGGEAYAARVKAAATASPHADQFIFAGYQPEPAPYYHAMDVVVHFSTVEEPFGMVVPEAMAAGKATIAAKAGGPLELIDDKVDGLLVTPGDVDALARAIETLASDERLREALGQRAWQRARASYSIEQAAAATLQVLHDALSQNGRAELQSKEHTVR